MTERIRILLVEDSDDDEVLLVRELRRAGFDPLTRRVDSEGEMRRALAETWDIVISDYNLPEFSAPAALRVLREAGDPAPLVIVSGVVNETIAVESLVAGARDFVTKGNLTRLAPAIRRELAESAVRRQRSAAVKALHEAQQRYRILFEHNPLPTVVVDCASSTFVEVNQAALACYGYDRERFLAFRAEQIFATEQAYDAALLLGGHLSSFRSRHVRASGRVFSVDMTCHPLDWDGRPARLCVISDVTERELLEVQLRQAQKMEAVGRLAGGVAHDFNNVLAIITSYVDLVSRELPDGDPNRDDLDEIRRAAQRAAGLTRQLLAFSRRQVVQSVIVELNPVVEDLAKMLRRMVGEDVLLDVELDPDAGLVRADVGQLEQSIVNLVVNARDAMPDGGRVVIRTGRQVLRDAYVHAEAERVTGDFATISVIDEGHGMSPETLAHIFEPFFTTKPVGKGTGLGLSTVFGTVRQAGGHLDVESAPGRGTEFRLYLPAVADPSSPPVPPPPASRRLDRARTILVVEDDPAVLRVATRILRSEGYEVLEAASIDAARAVAARAGAIDLLLVDVVLPGMRGAALAAEIGAGRPGMRVLLMSGHGDASFGQSNVLRERDAFLDKPFTPDSLTRKVRETIESGDGGR